jgi:hypothetical protein
MGLQVGLLATLATIPLIVGLNLFFRKNPLSIEIFNAMVGENAPNLLRDAFAKERFTRKNLTDLAKHTGIVTAETLGFGGAVGLTIATADITQKRDKLVKASRLKAGLPPNKPWYEFYKRNQKPKTPEQLLTEFKEKDLNQNHAFKRGAIETIALKVVGGGLYLATNFFAAQSIIDVALNSLLFNEKPTEALKLVGEKTIEQLKAAAKFAPRQPALMTKLITTPIIGGIVAMKLVPLINQRLGRPPQGQTPVAPIATPPTTAFASQSLAQPLPAQTA